MHRRARYAPSVTAQPCTEDASRRVTVIASLTSTPWGSCRQAPGVYCLCAVELESRERRGPVYKVAMGKLAGLLGVCGF